MGFETKRVRGRDRERLTSAEVGVGGAFSEGVIGGCDGSRSVEGWALTDVTQMGGDVLAETRFLCGD